MKYYFLAALAIGCAAGQSRAAVNIAQSSVPTVGLTGYHTFTLTASTDDGSVIQGFDFASTPDRGFFGTLNQVYPAGISTPFGDQYCDFCFIDPRPQDTHFLPLSNQLTIIPGSTVDSTTALRSTFAKGSPFGTSVPLVQLVIPDTSLVTFAGQVQTAVGSTLSNNNVAGTVQVPEPSAISFIGVLAVFRLSFIRRRK